MEIDDRKHEYVSNILHSKDEIHEIHDNPAKPDLEIIMAVKDNLQVYVNVYYYFGFYIFR